MTKDELEAALVISRRLERLRDKLNDLETTGGVGASPLSGSHGGKSGDPGQLAAELSEEIKSLVGKLGIEKEIIRRALEKIDFTETERKIMRLRYVECKRWKYIYFTTGYSKSRTLYYHSLALEKVRT